MSERPSKTAYYQGTNAVPKTADGRVTHVGTKAGEMANRILTVGSLSRAEKLAALLDSPEAPVSSSRGFTTFTGCVDGARVSVVATGMGAPMMDFLVREARAVVDGPMAFVRLGTCGGIGVAPGTVVANTPGSYAIHRRPDAWSASNGPAYVASRPVAPHPKLANLVVAFLNEVSDISVVEGLNASTDSFYSSQGRIDPAFDDRNSDWADTLLRADTLSVEMESFHLLHLANCAVPSAPIAAATVAICCAERRSGDVIHAEDLPLIERHAGLAILKALAAFDLGLAV